MFASKLGVIVATLGSAIGLGNIWKFPYLTGVNGGAAFVIIYILCTLVVGLPVMIAEHSHWKDCEGRCHRDIQETGSSNSSWWLVSGAGVLSAFLIMAFYTEVAGWVFAYITEGSEGVNTQFIARGDLIGFRLRSYPILSSHWSSSG
jgi:NSS family neurotransmitter:Na+ symporter